LLDAVLEGTMKRSLLILIAALFFVGSAYAFEIPFTDITILEPADPILNESNPVLVEPTLEVRTDVSFVEERSILDTVFRVTGISKGGTRNITVMLEGKVLGSIWGGSKFENVAIHKSCLSDNAQYGSEEWYACEVNR
jgi:hypothetical protein